MTMIFCDGTHKNVLMLSKIITRMENILSTEKFGPVSRELV